jgi:transcription antitermination factor NusG
LAQYCAENSVPATLPLYRTIHKYRGKTVEFQKPLFPGYLFLEIHPTRRHAIYQSDYVANLLDVVDQKTFKDQLEDILRALDTGLEIRLAPQIGEGSRVVIKSGPLRGMEGWVENRYGKSTVLLRLDFIGQAAAVNVEADDLELT